MNLGTAQTGVRTGLMVMFSSELQGELGNVESAGQSESGNNNKCRLVLRFVSYDLTNNMLSTGTS